MDYITRKALFF